MAGFLAPAPLAREQERNRLHECVRLRHPALAVRPPLYAERPGVFQHPSYKSIRHTPVSRSSASVDTGPLPMRGFADLTMNPSNVVLRAGSLALVSLLAGGCAVWDSIDRSERGIAVRPTGGAVVSRPASAPTVRLAQLALNDRGYDAGNIDGSLGPDTASAVRRFQQTEGLPQTGALDARTLSALGVDSATTRARRE